MADTTATAAVPQDPKGRPEGRYSTGQIVAHWTVVFLVLFQFATGDAMSAAYAVAVDFGRLPPDGILVVHGLIGTSILAAMAWRVALRARYGAPPPPDTLSRPLQIVSRAVHYVLYGILIAMPLLGITALIFKIGIFGVLHTWLSYALIATALLHVAGGLYHAVRRDGVIRRILRGSTYP